MKLILTIDGTRRRRRRCRVSRGGQISLARSDRLRRGVGILHRPRLGCGRRPPGMEGDRIVLTAVQPTGLDVRIPRPARADLGATNQAYSTFPPPQRTTVLLAVRDETVRLVGENNRDRARPLGRVLLPPICRGGIRRGHTVGRRRRTRGDGVRVYIPQRPWRCRMPARASGGISS